MRVAAFLLRFCGPEALIAATKVKRLEQRQRLTLVPMGWMSARALYPGQCGERFFPAAWNGNTERPLCAAFDGFAASRASRPRVSRLAAPGRCAATTRPLPLATLAGRLGGGSCLQGPP
jgi:hypothetical protein